MEQLVSIRLMCLSISFKHKQTIKCHKTTKADIAPDTHNRSSSSISSNDGGCNKKNTPSQWLLLIFIMANFSHSFTFIRKVYSAFQRTAIELLCFSALQSGNTMIKMHLLLFGVCVCVYRAYNEYDSLVNTTIFFCGVPRENKSRIVVCFFTLHKCQIASYSYTLISFH